MYKLWKVIKNNKFQIVQYSMLLIAFFSLIIFMTMRLEYILDSDIASQLVLSEFLSEKKALWSTDWFYATEIRVLSLQLIFTPLFWITSNWQIVRIVGVIILYILLLISIYYFCYYIGIKKYFGFIGAIFLLPFSRQYYDFVLKNVNYIPCLIISFFTIGMFFAYMKTDIIKRKKFLFIIICVLSVFAGMNGMRQMIIVYFPMLMASFLILILECYDNKKLEWKNIKKNKHISFVIINFSATVFNAIGYLINVKYLSKIFYYKDYTEMEWDGFSVFDFGLVIDGWFANLGFLNGELFSISAFYNLVSFVILLFLVWSLYYTFKNRNYSLYESIIMFSFLVAGFVISIILYCFTNMNYEKRYDLPIVVLTLPTIILYISQQSISETRKKIIIILLTTVFLFNGLNFYLKESKVDTTSELRNIAETLEKNDYRNGYATFWNANVMEELSNGYLEIWDWGEGSWSDINSVNTIYKWAQKKEHEIKPPQGKVFWILTEEEKTNFPFTKNVTNDYLLYESGNETEGQTKYLVYGFDSYEDMISIVGNYYIYFDNNDYVQGGRDVGGERYLDVGGISFGPYVTLYPGKYTICLKGKGLDNLTYDSVYKINNELMFLNIENVHHTSNYICYDVIIDNEIADCEARFFNNSSTEAILSSLNITRIEDYEMKFHDGKHLANGEDLNGIRHLYNKGISYGPYISLNPGKYAVSCEGQNLNGLTYDSVYKEYIDGELLFLDVNNVTNANDGIYYEFEIEHPIDNYEMRFFNNSNEDVVISMVKVYRID